MIRRTRSHCRTVTFNVSYSRYNPYTWRSDTRLVYDDYGDVTGKFLDWEDVNQYYAKCEVTVLDDTTHRTPLFLDGLTQKLHNYFQRIKGNTNHGK